MEPTVWEIIRGISIGAGTVGIAIPLLWKWALTAYDAIYERLQNWRQDRLTLEHLGDQNALHRVRIIERDLNGNLGVTLNTDGVYRNLDTGEIFTQLATLYLDPMRLKIDAMHRMLLAMRGIQGPSKAMEQLADTTETPIVWPATVALADLFRDRRPSIHDLVVGVYPTEHGLERVSDSLHNLMHILSVGASGWGKSTWLRSFLWQIARASEPCEVVAVDINGSEFNVLRGWGKLRYPVARSTQDAIALLGAVSEEINERKRLYENYAPIATKLDEYNESTGAGLPPWVVAIDEGTNLLNQKGLGEPLRAAVQTARQYGVYILLAGQTAKHNVVDTQIRDQFSTRLCFRMSPTSSRTVLDDSAAGDLHDKGRAFVQLPGCELQEIQGPYIDREAFMRALGNGGPKLAMPVAPAANDGLDADQVDDPSLPDGERARRLYDAGLSKRQIALRVYSGDGGAAWRKMEEAINGSSSTVEVVEPGDPNGETDERSTTTTTDWCEYCDSDTGPFAACTLCGVAICSRCAVDGLCPDCHQKQGERR